MTSNIGFLSLNLFQFKETGPPNKVTQNQMKMRPKISFFQNAAIIDISNTPKLCYGYAFLSG